MRVLCFGAGSVGCLLSGYLADAGAQLTLLCRPGQDSAIDEHGLEIVRPQDRLHIRRMQTLTSLSQWNGQPPDVILLAVKAYDGRPAVEEIKPIVGRDTIILTVQNGIGNEEMLAEMFGSDRILSGALTLSVSRPELNRVQQNTNKGGLGLAPVGEGMSSRLAELCRLWSGAGLTVSTYEDYRSLKWSKLLINLFGNASAAILDMSPKDMAKHAKLFSLELQQARECLRVMKAQKIHTVDLPGFPVHLLGWLLHLPDPILYRLLRQKLVGGRGEKMPSLWVDLQRGRNDSEIHVLNGAVYRAGQRLGVPVPANELLYQTLVGILEGTIDRDSIRHQPDKLLTMLEQPTGWPFKEEEMWRN